VLSYQQAITHFPEQASFLRYVRAHYHEVSHFENSQALFGVDSKPAGPLPRD
jgi:hypothetical protein